MKKKTTKKRTANSPTVEEKDKVETLLFEFEEMFNITNYERTVSYSKDNKEDSAAMVKVDEPYQRIHITIYPCFWKHHRDRQRAFLLHELCHAIVNPLDVVIEAMLDGKLETREHHRVATERVVSHITEMTDRFLRGGWKKKKKFYSDYLKK